MIQRFPGYKIGSFSISERIGILILFVSIIITVICLKVVDQAPDGFKTLWLLPISYGLLFIITNMKAAVTRYVGIAALNVILIGRYLLLPAMSAISGTYFHSFTAKTSGTYNSQAVVLLIFELFAVFLTMHFLVKRLDKFNIQKPDNQEIDAKRGIFIIVLILGVISFVLFPAIRERTNILIPSGFTYTNLDTLSSIAYLLAANALPVLLLLVITNEYLRDKAGQKVRQLMIVLIALINISVFYGPGRMSVLAQGLATLAILGTYKVTSRKVLAIILALTGLIIITLSAYRWFGTSKVGIFYTRGHEFFTDQVISNMLQSYFGGPHMIATALRAREGFMINAGIDTFINEILSTILFVRQVFPPSPELSTVIYNHLFGYTQGNSIIIPTLGQSYMYFGTLGAPILSILFCFLLYKAEMGVLKSKSIGEKYAFYLLAIWLALFPMQNLNLVTQTIFNKFLPLFLIVKANAKFRIRFPRP